MVRKCLKYICLTMLIQMLKLALLNEAKLQIAKFVHKHMEGAWSATKMGLGKLQITLVFAVLSFLMECQACST